MQNGEADIAAAALDERTYRLLSRTVFGLHAICWNVKILLMRLFSNHLCGHLEATPPGARVGLHRVCRRQCQIRAFFRDDLVIKIYSGNLNTSISKVG